MKKFLLLSASFVLAIALSGQSRWTFGLDVEGGFSGKADLEEHTYLDDTFGDYYYKTEVRRQPGFSGGVWTEFLLSQRVGLRLGVNYSQWRDFSEAENISYNTEDVMTSYGRERYYQRQSQLRIPLETHFYFGKPNSRARFFLKAGVQAGYLLAQTNTVNSFYGAAGQPEYDYSYEEEIDLTAEWTEVKRWQTSFIGGFGVTMDRATLSLQTTWGLSKKADDYSYPYGGCCGFGGLGLCNCYLPYPTTSFVKQLQQTTLRFAYAIW